MLHAHVWTIWRGKQYLSKPGFKRSEWEDHGPIHEKNYEIKPAGPAQLESISDWRKRKKTEAKEEKKKRKTKSQTLDQKVVLRDLPFNEPLATW